MADDTEAFLELNDAELAALRPVGERVPVSAGQYLYREGDPAYDFYVVLAGVVEIVVTADGAERVLARYDDVAVGCDCQIKRAEFRVADQPDGPRDLA